MRFTLEKCLSGLIRMGLIAGALFMVVLLVRYAASGYACGDALESTFQAMEIKDAGTLFPGSWIATNFAHLQVLPLYVGTLFSHSYVTANRIGLLAVFALLLLTLAVFARKGLRDGSGLLFAVVMVFPVSELILQQFFTGAFYTQFVVGILLVLAAWLSACFDGTCAEFGLRPKKVPVAVLATFLCCALMGSRMIAVLCLPIAGAIVWMSVMACPTACGCARRCLAAGIAAVAIGVAAVLGNWIYEAYVMPAFGVPASVVCADNLLHFVYTGEAVAANLGAIFEGTMRMFGFPFGYPMTNSYAVLSLMGFVAALCLYVIFPILEICSYRRLDDKSRFLVVMAFSSVAITLFILTFGHLGKGDEWNMCARYLMLPGVLLLIVGVRHAHRTFRAASDFRVRIVAIGLVLALATTAAARWQNVSRDERERWSEVAKTLSAEKLDYGYATYENAILPWFYSEGLVRIPHVTLEEGRLSIPGFCVAERWYDPESHVGPTFLMLTDAELAHYAPQGLEGTVLGKPKRTLRVGKYKVLVYDHNIAQDLFGTMNGPVKYLWGFSGQWVRNGSAKMEMRVPDALRGKDAELVLKVQSFGESVSVSVGEEPLGSFRFPPSDTDWSEKTVCLPVPSRFLLRSPLKLRLEATGQKSPREHGWHGDKTQIGPHLLSAELYARSEDEKGRGTRMK